jgi:hypothetical protein
MSKYIKLVFVLILPVFLSSCMKKSTLNDEQVSAVSGADISELERAQQQDGAVFMPLYDHMLQNNVVKIALFFSFDRDYKANNDYGTKAYRLMSNWFLNSGFLADANKKSLVVGSGIEAATISGLRVAPGLSVAGNVQWEISLYLGRAESLSEALGRAMVDNSVTILSGHFYPEDAMAAEGDSYWRDAGSRIYGPALDVFAEHASSSELKYRMVGFNGCYSEAIEDLVLQKSGTHNIDILGMRGISNYKHFGNQLAGLLSSISKGANWLDLLSAMKFDDSSGDRLGVIPVLRNDKVGGGRKGIWDVIP